MDPDKDIAEERLLRVIEKGQARTASVAMEANKGSSLFKWIRMWFAHHYARPIGREGDATLKMLRTLSGVLWLALACFGIYFAMNFMAHYRTPLHERAISNIKRMTGKSTGQIEAPAQAELKTQSQYVDAMQNPNPFTGSEEEVAVTDNVRGSSPAEKLAEMTKGLVVVGINRGPNPDAIVENSQEKRTYFVKAGDKINELTVKEIKHDTVLLTYEGEDVEIV